jgi:hypothetical protein
LDRMCTVCPVSEDMLSCVAVINQMRRGEMINEFCQCLGIDI